MVVIQDEELRSQGTITLVLLGKLEAAMPSKALVAAPGRSLSLRLQAWR